MTSLFALIDKKVSALPLYIPILIYIGIIIILSVISYWRKWLKLSGVFASAILGFATLYFGGFSAFLLLFFFLFTSSLISKVKKKNLAVETKSGARDYLQVLANGLPFLIGLLLSYYTPYKRAWQIAFASALAETTSDTWASEIGTLSNQDPISIVTRTRVPKGLSGGISILGTMGAFLGSFLMALLFIGSYKPSWTALAIITLSGFSGSFVDSFLGATIQVHYRDKEGFLSEKKEKNGEKNERSRGIPFVTNDVVNFISSFFSLSFGFILAFFIKG